MNGEVDPNEQSFTEAEKQGAENFFRHTRNAPKTGTGAFQKYLNEHNRVLGFFFFITRSMHSIDVNAKKAAEALSFGRGPEEQEKYAGVRQRGAGAVRQLQRSRDIFMEMMLCRMVDNYLVYIAELIRSIFRHNPESLKSSETERIDFILSYSDMGDLIQAIAEKRVHELSYKGMEDISKYFLDRFGIDLFLTPRDKEVTIELIQKRNLIVHNRGIANAIYIQKAKTPGLAVGDRVDFTADEFFSHLDNLCAAAIHLQINEPLRSLDFQQCLGITTTPSGSFTISTPTMRMM